MKKVMFLMAVAGMFAFAACNNNAEEATTDTLVDTTATEVVEETVVDTNAPVAEEVATEEAAQ